MRPSPSTQREAIVASVTKTRSSRCSSYIGKWRCGGIKRKGKGEKRRKREGRGLKCTTPTLGIATSIFPARFVNAGVEIERRTGHSANCVTAK